MDVYIVPPMSSVRLLHAICGDQLRPFYSRRFILRSLLTLYGHKALRWSWKCVRESAYDPKFRVWVLSLINMQAESVPISEIWEFLFLDNDALETMYGQDCVALKMYEILTFYKDRPDSI